MITDAVHLLIHALYRLLLLHQATAPMIISIIITPLMSRGGN